MLKTFVEVKNDGITGPLIVRPRVANSKIETTGKVFFETYYLSRTICLTKTDINVKNQTS
mgnify:FL=1|jgi:hypothetical protein